MNSDYIKDMTREVKPPTWFMFFIGILVGMIIVGTFLTLCWRGEVDMMKKEAIDRGYGKYVVEMEGNHPKTVFEWVNKK